VGADRFVAEVVRVPEERQGLYQGDPLRFASGRIIKDQGLTEETKETTDKLRELRALFKQQRDLRAKPDQKAELKSTFGKFPKTSPSAQCSNVERASLYVLSHLELQNTSRDLLFSTDGLERMNACLSQLRNPRPHEKLFVWEPEVAEKKKECMNSLMIIIVIVGFLILQNFFRL
jgi:hypothetical protein